MSQRQRVTLYLDSDVYKRTVVALEALNTSVSEYVRDFMAANLDALEVGALTQDPQEVAKAFQRDLGDVVAFQLDQFAEMLRHIQAAARGEGEKEKA